jgi:3-hydroxyisobutyrate dehydrogenase-like beta-hydroxyacid dehydrogenase
VSLIMDDGVHVVAVVGLGTMGSAMARRIHGAGHELIVWNRDRAKAEALVADTPATIAATAAAAAERAEIILTSLADDVAVKAVYEGSDGIADGIRPGSLAVDTSTVDPNTIRAVGDAIDAAGADFFDCPVSGSVATVEAGALTMMAGAGEELIERAGAVLATISQRVIPIGPRGSGAACKLAVNALLHGLNVALAEALVLAERAGIERRTAYEVFASGAGGAPFVQYKRQAYENPGEEAVAFSLDLVAKDLELITGLGKRVGAPMDQAAAGLDITRRAIAAGLGARDMSAIALYLRGEE